MATQTQDRERTTQHPRETNGLTIVQLLKNLRDEAVTMMRQEVALAKVEFSEKTRRTMGKLALLVAGGVFAVAGLIVLLQAISVLVTTLLAAGGVDAEVAAWLGGLLVGGIVLIVGWIMVAAGKRALRNEAEPPRQTINSMKETREWAQRKVER